MIPLAHGLVDDAQARAHVPGVVPVDAGNQVVGRRIDPAEALPGTCLQRGDVVETTLVG